MKQTIYLLIAVALGIFSSCSPETAPDDEPTNEHIIFLNSGTVSFTEITNALQAFEKSFSEILNDQNRSSDEKVKALAVLRESELIGTTTDLVDYLKSQQDFEELLPNPFANALRCRRPPCPPPPPPPCDLPAHNCPEMQFFTGQENRIVFPAREGNNKVTILLNEKVVGGIEAIKPYKSQFSIGNLVIDEAKIKPTDRLLFSSENIKTGEVVYAIIEVQ